MVDAGGVGGPVEIKLGLAGVVVDDDEGVVVDDDEVVVVDEARQMGFEIVLDSRVTAPFRANRRPLIVAPVFAAMEVSANTVP